jgi:phosphoenolpyruvate synthase/pyruvate phosphate dikinase
MGKRAVDYRNQFKIPHDLGSAAKVVTMVFGNIGDDSGTSVAFTRDPSTGRKRSTASSCPTHMAKTWWPTYASLSKT